ncbi:MAG: S-methyl-5'-thioadenosine phosphorylase [Parvularculaceae bacterium]|nr:S-methyl-5'-thioadenosine phosphorylase [Parvularculaceae bacterium]
MKRRIGVIGGSGVYALEALDDVEKRAVETPWGEPSGPLTTGSLGGVEMIFLARHGEGHTIPPSEVNYRANIDAMKRLGATDILSISACGSFREELPPGMFVIVDQYIDRTSGRSGSFFGAGCVAHVSMAAPVCAALGDALEASALALSITCRRGGTYIAIDGPQFSSRAESLLYKSWGADVIGMTNMPEAKLAREAELPYASLAMVTDFDCWRVESGHVEVAHILEVMRRNTEAARRLIADVAARLGPTREMSPAGIERTLDSALITPPDRRDPALLAKLDAVAGRVLAGG